MPLWEAGEIDSVAIRADVDAGCYLIGEISGELGGVLRFQLEDPVFWPEVRERDAAYVHRMAVRRRLAGKGLSSALLATAAARASELGRRYLRLACPASRPQLRAVYEDFGFQHHSERQVGPYFVSRYEYEVRLPAAGPP